MQSPSNVMSGNRSIPSRQTPIKTDKRKRTLLELEDFSSELNFIRSSKGDMEIGDADSTGRYIELTNKRSKVSSL